MLWQGINVFHCCPSALRVSAALRPNARLRLSHRTVALNQLLLMHILNEIFSIYLACPLSVLESHTNIEIIHGALSPVLLVGRIPGH
jgi:hypothetical protein